MIRRAQPGDIAALAELLAVLFSIETDFRIDHAKQRQGLRLLLDHPEHCCVMVAEAGRRVVGMCSGQLLVSTAAGGYKAIIEDLVVAAGQRGRGIGAALLAAVENWAAAQGAVRLDLLADRRNQPALTFYRQRRWRQTELIALQKPCGDSSGEAR